MKKLCAAIGDHVQEVEFCQQEREQLLRWMKRRFAAEGHDIDIAAADHLLFTCGTLMTDLVPEIGKSPPMPRASASPLRISTPWRTPFWMRRCLT